MTTRHWKVSLRCSHERKSGNVTPFVNGAPVFVGLAVFELDDFSANPAEVRPGWGNHRWPLLTTKAAVSYPQRRFVWGIRKTYTRQREATCANMRQLLRPLRGWSSGRICTPASRSARALCLALRSPAIAALISLRTGWRSGVLTCCNSLCDRIPREKVF